MQHGKAVIPETLKTHPALRECLLNHFLDTSTSPGLSDWLRDINIDQTGSVEAKRQRIRAHTKYLSMPAAEFPDQTESYLSDYPSHLLADLCCDLGLPTDGSKDARYRRILREVRICEGWFPAVQKPVNVDTLKAATVVPILGWFPIKACGSYEKDFYPAIHEELEEVFGDIVYEQIAVAHGTTLKIDFHVGDPHGHGVGVEVKMPVTNADVQRAIGQLDQYQRRYGENIVMLVIGDLAKPEVLKSLTDALVGRGVPTIIR